MILTKRNNKKKISNKILINKKSMKKFNKIQINRKAW